MNKTGSQHGDGKSQKPSAVKRLIIASLKISVFLIAFLLVALAMLHVPPIQNKVGRYLIHRLSQTIHKEIYCDSFRISLLGTIELNGVSILHDDAFGDQPLASVDSLYIVFDPLSFHEDRFHVRELYVNRPVFNLIYNEARVSNLRIAGRPRHRNNGERNKDDTRVRAFFDTLQVDHISISNGRFSLDYAPSDYYLDVPEFNLEARYAAPEAIYQTEISGGTVFNHIPGNLDSRADVSIKANVWGGGVRHALVTVTSNTGAFWLHSNCVLENFVDPHLVFDGALSTNLHEVAEITELNTDLNGPVDLFFHGEGPAENLDISGQCFGRDIAFNRFRFASFNGKVLYFDREFTIQNGSGSAYRGNYEGSGSIAFSPGSKDIDISARVHDADLAALSADLDIPFLFQSRCDASLAITGNGFNVNDLKIQGFVSGTEIPVAESNGEPVKPMTLSAEFTMENGVFGIPAGILSGGYHSISLHNGIFDKSTLKGSISGQTTHIGDLLRRLNRYTPEEYNFPGMSGPAVFDLRLGGSLSNYDVHLDLNSPDVYLMDQSLGSAALKTSISPVHVNIDSISLEGPGLKTRGEIDLALPFETSAEGHLPITAAALDIETADISFLKSFYNPDIPLSGSVTGSLIMHSPGDTAMQQSRIQASGVRFRDISIGDLEIRGTVQPGGIFDLDLTAFPGNGTIEATANIPFQSPAVFDLKGQAIPFAMVPGLETIQPSGSFDITVETENGHSSSGIILFEMNSNQLSIQGINTGAVSIQGSITRETPSTVQWSARWNQTMLESDGQCLLNAELPCTSRIRLNDFPLTIPMAVANPGNTNHQLRGHLTAVADFQGSLRTPSDWNSRIDVADFSADYAGVRLDLQESALITLNGTRVSVSGAHLTSSQADLNVSGTLSTTGEMTLNVAGNTSLTPIETVTDFIENVSGNLVFDTQLTGDWKDPQFSGALYIQEFYGHIPTFDLWLEDYHSEIQLNQKLGKIVYLEGIAGGSYLGGSGELGFSGYIPDLLDIQLTGDDVDFEYPRGFDSMASIRLDISGTLNEPMIAGDVDVKQSTYANRINYKTMIVNESRARLTFGEKRMDLGNAPEAAAFNPRFNLKIQGPDNIFINNNLARVEMGVKLSILGSLMKPQVLGHVDVLSGEVTLLQRNFELMNAGIEFADPTRIDPQVSFQAEADIDEYQVTLDINGRLHSDLNIQPSSTPPLNELDLWNLIVIGKTRENMASSSDYLASGVAYVTGSLQEQIEQRFEYWMGFDEFSIDPIMSTSDESPSAKFTVKKRFSPDLSVLYSRSASSSGDLVVIEYRISENLFVIGQKTEDNSIGADLRYRWEFE